jgi:hypothetical protein
VSFISVSLKAIGEDDMLQKYDSILDILLWRFFRFKYTREAGMISALHPLLLGRSVNDIGGRVRKLKTRTTRIMSLLSCFSEINTGQVLWLQKSALRSPYVVLWVSFFFSSFSPNSACEDAYSSNTLFNILHVLL